MRILRTIALAGVVLGLAAALVPAHAICGAAQQVTTIGQDNRSHVWHEDWAVTYYAVGVAPATYSGLPPITADFFAVYWGLETGDTALTLGDDSGAYTVPPASWAYWTFLAGVYPTAAKVFGTWAQSTTIDGCVATNTCECLLMTDELDGKGYFAIATALTDAGGNAFFVQDGTDPLGWATPIILRGIPVPDVTSVDLNQDTLVETWNVTVPDVAGPLQGVYELDGCDCGPTGYQIYTYTAPSSDVLDAPVSRDAAQWTAATAVTPMGTPTSFEIDCAALPADSAIYAATGLVFDSSFPGGPYKVTLSSNFGPVACGTNLADPVDLQPKQRTRDQRGISRTDRKER
jgi:hypothetical protein